MTTRRWIDIYKPSVSRDAIGVIFGLWLIASARMLGLAEWPAAATNGVVVGLLAIGYALWALRIDRRGPGTRYA